MVYDFHAQGRPNFLRDSIPDVTQAYYSEGVASRIV